MKGSNLLFGWIAVMLSASIIGCGKPDSGGSAGGSTPSDDSQSGASESLEVSKDKIRRASVSCEDKSTCSPSVAMLAIATLKDGVHRCTAFLVSADMLLTNSHCVPSDLRADANPLDSRIFAYFPETKSSAALSVEVDHVISASEIDENPKSPNYSTLADYSFLRLKKSVFRPKMALNYNGLNPDTWVTIYKMNPSKYTLSATLVEKNCQTARSNTLLRNYISAYVPLVSLVDCDIIQGNSGSPVVTEDGTVSAVIFAGGFKKGVYFSSSDGEAIGYSNYARATNLACIAPPWSPNRNLPSDCKTRMLEPYSTLSGADILQK